MSEEKLRERVETAGWCLRQAVDVMNQAAGGPEGTATVPVEHVAQFGQAAQGYAMTGLLALALGLAEADMPDGADPGRLGTEKV